MDSERRRRRLVPRSAIIIAGVVLVLIAATVAGFIALDRSREVSVPSVIGLPSSVAEESLAGVGLGFEVAGTRVSVDTPAGAVVSQDPGADAVVGRGTIISVVLSAGRQTVIVPDVVGIPLDDARTRILDAGLTISVDTVSAEATEGIVLETFPSAGTEVAAGDLLRVTVSGKTAGAGVLLPYDFTGLTLIIDPSPPVTGEPDTTYDVARRLRSLLEASGARVVVSRSVTETWVPEADRVRIAQSTPTAAFIGMDVATGGAPGITLLALPEGTTDGTRLASSLEIARQITNAARLPGQTINTQSTTADPVAAAAKGPAVRVVLGSLLDAADKARFADPAWADGVARAVYRGLGAALIGP
jgi:hypothetical protein